MSSSSFVNHTVRMAFPGVAARFDLSASWHKQQHGIEPLFGVFWNWCLNGYFPKTLRPHQSPPVKKLNHQRNRVHCTPHADAKNPISICALMMWVLKGCEYYTYMDILCISLNEGYYTVLFDHSRRSWLVIWEAGVIVQLPPWVLFIYPSSLFYHFNIDIHGMPYFPLHINLQGCF